MGYFALAASLLGIGGASLLIHDDPKKFNFISQLIPTAYCGCGEEENKCCKPKKCEDSDCLRKSEQEEELIKKANCELEKALRETKCRAVEFTEEALKAYCCAIDATKKFMDKVYCATEDATIDSPGFDDSWFDVKNWMCRRADLAKSALEKGQCAWELLRRLGDIIENGRLCKYTSCNPLLCTAEETLVCAEKELCAKKKEMDDLLKESRVAEQYRNLVEEFRRDLKGEAESLVPSDEARVTLTENEANMILTHVYKKILRCQKELQKTKC